MKKYAKVNRSWVLYQTGHIVTSGSLFASQNILADDENAFSVSGRVIRAVGAVNLTLQNPPALPASNPVHVALGLAVIDQNLSAGVNIASAEMADRRFVARSILGGYPEGTGISGAVSSFGWTHRFDWQIRAGRGVTINKDSCVVLCTACTFLPVGSTLGAQYAFNLLFETD